MAFKKVSCDYYLLLVEFINNYPRFQYADFEYTFWRDIIFKLKAWFADPDRLALDNHYSATYWSNLNGLITTYEPIRRLTYEISILNIEQYENIHIINYSM